MTNEELIKNIWATAGLHSNELHEWRAELLRRLGAAVSAPPQPRCPKCQSDELVLWRQKDAIHDVTCNACFGIFDLEIPADMAQFFAAAPVQEPDSGLLARYNRAYSILGEALNLNAEFYGLVEMAQVAANRLTGNYDLATQESPKCCDFTGEHWLGCPNIGKVAAQEQPVEPSPQKGKP